jgi:hypothetical protein
VAYTYLYRKYFGAFMIYVSKNNIKNGIALGMSDSDFDVNRLKMFLTSLRDGSFGDGDYSSFEASSSSVSGDSTIQFINKWYSQVANQQEDNLVRTMLWQASNRPFFLYRGNIFHAPGGNPSGQPGTALKNNLDNVRLFRTCFQNLCPGYNFDESVRFVAGGDDHVWVVARDLLEQFSPTTIQKEMERIGMLWTPAKKDDEVVDDVPQEDILFNSRNLEGILKDESIQKMLHFVRNDDIVGCTRTNIDTALRELSRRDKPEFDAWRDKIIASCVKSGFRVDGLWTYQQAMAHRLADDFITLR